jgi:hypothetical protein
MSPIFLALAALQTSTNTALSSVITAIANKASTPSIDGLVDEFVNQQKRIWQLLDFVGEKVGLPAPVVVPPKP